MEKDEILDKLYQKALRFLSYRPRSEKEVSDFLLKKKRLKRFQLNKDFKNFVSLTVEKLKKENLIDDNQFVDWWIEQRLEFNLKGKKVIRLELIQKGIDRNLIDEKLSSVDDKLFEKAAKKIIGKKEKLYQKLSNRVKKDKLLKHLLRRGFDYQTSKDLVDEHLEKR